VLKLFEQSIALLGVKAFYTGKEGGSLAKQSTIVAYRVNCKLSDIRNETFKEVRRKCRRPYASSSKISRAFWMVLFNDKKLRSRVMCAVSEFLDKYDTGE